MPDESAVEFLREGAHPNDDERLARLVRHMAEIPELPTLVLTGHLLLEEMLSEILGECFQHSELIESTRLSFAQKLTLCRAASWDQHDNEAWALIGALNKVRNELAHKLESPKLDSKLAHLRTLYLGRYQDEAGKSDADVVRGCVAHASGFLSECVLEAYELRRVLSFSIKKLLAQGTRRGPAT